MAPSPKPAILFVCLGNICRSPTAEGVFRQLLRNEGVEGDFEVDSAGTGGWHAGASPDPRMAAAAAAMGFTLSGQARQVTADDYDRFDHILAMDRDNLETLLSRAPAHRHHKIRLFREHDPENPGEDTPDPYYGGPEGFQEVVRIAERTARRLLHELRSSA